MSLDLSIQQALKVEDVVKIAEDAAAAILQVYNSEVADWGIQSKADDSPLTQADQEANAVICAGLARIAPHIPIVSEENKQLPYETRKNYLYSWCVDPLDGTKEFIKRNGQFTVNIALLRGGKPILGVVQIPAENKVYYAVEGQGAFVKDSSGSRRIECATFDPSATGVVIVGSASHSSKETEEFIADYKEPQFKQLGSSLKLLMVAEGHAHVYPRLAPTCEWDTAAAHAIVLEAGGVVLQAGKCDNKGKALENWRDVLAKQESVVYNKVDPLNPYFVVYGKKQ